MLLFLFIKLRILFRFLFLHTSKDQLVTVVAVIQRTVYAADGGGGSSGLLGNLQICLAVLQHGSHFEPLDLRRNCSIPHGTADTTPHQKGNLQRPF